MVQAPSTSCHNESKQPALQEPTDANKQSNCRSRIEYRALINFIYFLLFYLWAALSVADGVN